MADTLEPVLVSSEGITASRLVWRRFKRPMPGLVEKLYSVNPGLAGYGVELPAGITVMIPVPDEVPRPTTAPITLWG